MALFVRDLTDQEWEELEQLTRHPESEVPTQRLMIVLLSAQGQRVQDVSREVDLHPINVRKWIHRFNEEGVEGLRSGKSPGRPPVFTNEQRDAIVEVASADPRQLGLNFSQWSLQRLRKYLIQNDVVEQISVETIRQVLRANGVKHRSNRGWRKDSNASRKGHRPMSKRATSYESQRRIEQYASNPS